MGRKARHHWYVLYKQLQPQIDGYRGSESVNILVQSLAQSVGYDAKVLLRIVKTGRFLDRIAPGLPADEVRCGYAHLEIVERLHQLDSAKAEQALEKCLLGETTLKDLSALLRDTAAQVGTWETNARSKARSRVAEHERLTGAAILQAGAEYFGVPAGQIIKVTESDFFSQFFMIELETQLKVAIFIRVGDTSRKQEKAASDLLKLASLAHGYFDKIWFIFPDISRIVQELSYHAHTIGAFNKWLYIETLDLETKTLQNFSNLSHTFSEQLFGGSPLKWRGYSLPGKIERNGEFAVSQ